jgi:hypothetical protein
MDIATGRQVNLFNPRRDDWSDHFAVQNAHVVGLTAAGRVTVRLLDVNSRRRVKLRRQLIAQGELET